MLEEEPEKVQQGMEKRQQQAEQISSEQATLEQAIQWVKQCLPPRVVDGVGISITGAAARWKSDSRVSHFLSNIFGSPSHRNAE